VASSRKLSPPPDFDPATGPVSAEEMASALPASEFFARQGLPMPAKPKVGRPRSSKPSQQVTLRIHPDTIAFFKADGEGWQRRMLDVLDKEAGREKKAG